MATFTSGISWETDEWFRTFSESFPQYTQPGIWIAAEERFASLRGAKLEWEATTRTVRLKLKNSRGQPYTLAMHFYPGAVHAAAPIVEAAAKIPGLLECLRAGDLPASLLEAINASGLDIFMRRPGSIQFDPGMMSSECALLIAAFMHDLELDPGRWFKFIGIDFQKSADEALSAAGVNHSGAQSPDGPAAETLFEAQGNAASAANPQEPLFAAGEALTGNFPFADLEDDALRLSADIAPADIPDLGAEANLTRLRLWQAPGVPMLSPTIVSALPSSGLSAVQAKRSWCAFGDIEARTFMQNLLSAASLTADEALKMLARREARQERLGTASPNSKWTRFLLSTIEKEPSAELPPLKLLSGHHPWDRIVFALQTEDQSIHWAEESGDMIMALLIPTRRDLAGADASFVVWRALAEAAAQILAARAVLPLPAPAHYESDAADQSADGMCVYWHPALNAPGVKNLLKQVSALIGPLLPLQPLAPQCRAFAGLSTHPDAPYAGVYLALTLLITSLMRHTSKRNREIARHLVGRRVRSTLTGEGFAPNAASLPDLKNVLAGFFALPIAAAALPAKLLLTGVLENGALKLTLSLPPRQGPRKGEPLTLADWDGPEGNTAGPNRIVREALQLLAADSPLFAEFGPNFDQPSQIERSRWEYFLFTELPELSACGVDAVLPESMRRIEKPEIVLTAAASGNARMQKRLATQGMLNAAALADFRWEIAVGDERMTLAELRARINQEGELLSSGSALFHLTKEDLDRLVAEWAEAQKKELSNWDKLRALLSGSANGRRVEAAEALLERIRESAAVKELPPPVELNAVLRPYQIRGFSWLVQNAMLGLGSLLADDMGLGKTVQVIACVAELKARGELDRGKVLIAAPASLLVNWEREIERFAPGLTAQIYHGKDRTIFALDHNRPDVIITSYGILKRELPQLSQMQFRLLVLDEAQAVKNAKTGQAKAAQEFPADSVIALTGTPVENRLAEYWSIFSIVEPGLLGSPAQFRRDFVMPIEEHRDRAAIDRFRRITSPFLLRRVKTDPGILDELPEKNVVDYFTTLTPKQVALYEECLKANLESLETLDRESREQEAAGDRLHAAQARLSRRGQILRMILNLKQISNSPSQFQKEWVDKPDSGKAEALLELLRRCRQSGRKALVFTQFREMGERLVRWIEDATGRKPEFLHGGVPAAKRMEMVDAFQNNPDSEVFILSLKAGGTGLNLTAASAVIHYDLWWNPAVEDQASDRAWRIGQRRDVVVYRFITAGTFEEKVNEMLKKKRELADLAVGVGESWIGDLTDDEIKSIFSLSSSGI